MSSHEIDWDAWHEAQQNGISIQAQRQTTVQPNGLTPQQDAQLSQEFRYRVQGIASMDEDFEVSYGLSDAAPIAEGSIATYPQATVSGGPPIQYECHPDGKITLYHHVRMADVWNEYSVGMKPKPEGPYGLDALLALTDHGE